MARFGFLNAGGHSSDTEPLSDSAQAIIAAMAESQNHVTRVSETIMAEHRRVTQEMLSSLRPGRIIQPYFFDAGQTQRQVLTMPQGVNMGSVYVENTTPAANVTVFLGENATDPTTGMGPLPYMKIGPGKWKLRPVNPYTRVGLLTVIADAVSAGVVSIFIDSKILGANQGSV